MRLSYDRLDNRQLTTSVALPSNAWPNVGGKDVLTFVGLVLFTLLLYIRPNELYPEIFGSAPIVKTLAVVTVLAYVVSKAVHGEPITIWPIEVKMVLLLFGLGVLFVPFAASPKDSIDVLSDTFVKVALIFVLMVNVIDRRSRLEWILKCIVVCGTWLALCAARDYQAGLGLDNGSNVARITGVVGGIFGNANDLATALVVVLPIAVALALNSAGVARAMYWACAGALAVGVVITFSRTGFLGLMAVGCVLLWKLGRDRRAVTILAAVLVFGSFVVAAPGGYGDRLGTIVNIQQDATGSAQERRELMERAAIVALYHPLIGVGMGNFHIYSIREKVAHNAYLETAAELGLVGLVAYLILIVAPFMSLRRIERRLIGERRADETGWNDRESHDAYVLCVAFQASFVAYMVCSFFGSIQYQWLLYYLVAHSVALRRIYSDQVAAPPPSIDHADELPDVERGVLWRSYQKSDATPVPEPDLFDSPAENVN